MKKLILAVLVAACPLAAEVACPASVKVLSVSQGGFSLELEWDNPTNGVTETRLRITDAATWTAETTYSYDTNDSADGVSMHVTNLAPATAYLVDFGLNNGSGFSDYTDCQAAIALIDCNGLTFNCDETVDADGGGAGTDLILEITTPAGDGTPTAPTAPTHSNTFVEIDPATDLDNSATVTMSGDECTNLNALMESQQTAMDAAGSNLIYGVKIPSGVICRPEHETLPLDNYSCPTITDSTNKLLVYSEYPNTNAHAPFGGSIDPGAGVGSIEGNLNSPTTSAPLIQCNDQLNIRFQRVRIARPDFTLLNYPTISITSISAASPPVMTLSGGIDVDQYFLNGGTYGSLIVRAPGMKSRWFHGGINPQYNGASQSLWVYNSGSAYPFHTFTDAGSYTSGGIVHQRIAAEITSATKASEPVLTFGADHGYDNGYQYTLDDIDAGVATIAAAGTHNDTAGDASHRPVVLVDGTTGGCDGLYKVNSVTTTTWTLDGAPTGCTGGTLELVHTAMLHHMESLSFTQQACIVDFESTTTAKVLLCYDGINTAYVPDWTAVVGTISGWLSLDGPVQQPLVRMADSTNIEFEQVIMDGGEMPWRNGALVSAANATEPIMAGSWARTHHWMVTNPVTLIATTDFGQNANVYDMIWEDGEGGVGLQMLNNTVTAGGFVYQSQDNIANTGSPTDITVDGLRVNVPTYCHSDDTASGGQVCGSRHIFQWKAGVMRAKIDGLAVSGWYQDSVSQPWAIFAEIIFPASETTRLRGIQDISITNSYVEGPTFVQLGAGGLGGANTKPSSNHYARFLIDNNFIRRVVRPAAPTGDSRGTAAYYAFNPNGLSILKLSELAVTNNTFSYPEESRNSAWNPIFDFGNKPTDGNGMSMVKVDKNLIMDAYSSVGTYGKVRCSSQTNTWSNCIENHFNLFGVVDSAYSDWGTNYVVAALETPDLTNPALDANNDACSDVVTKWDDSGGDNGYATHFPVVSCADAETANERMDDVFSAGTWNPAGAYATYGADITDILRAQGRITDVLHQSTSSTIVLTYNAPEINGICRATATAGTGENPANDANVFYDDDTVGSYARTATITGLSSGTTYAYRIACSGGTVVKGEVATQ